MPERYPNPYADAWGDFHANTRNHQLTILHDDDLYRHLRMAEPGTRMWSWSVVTWPGYMAVVGDIGDGFTFCREEDMLAWADTRKYGDYYGDGSPNINANYWAEKLVHACRDAARAWSWGKFEQHVKDLLDEEPPANPGALLEDMDGLNQYDADAAIEWARGHIHQDAWEWDCTEYTHGYLRACYAIATTVRAYYATKEPA